MLTKKRFAIISLLVIFGIFGSFGFARLNNFLEWKITEEAIATGGWTYPLGLANLNTAPCYLSNLTPPTCIGGVTGVMCATLSVSPDPKGTVACPIYSEVIGVPAGGAGNQALFITTFLTAAGVVPGGQLIAGGYGPSLMDQGPLAGPGGCVNCMAKGDSELKQKLAMMGKVVVAAFRE